MDATLSRRRLVAALAAAAALAAGEGRAQTPAAPLELVMVERAGCAWCARWDAEIAPLYAKTPEAARAPLRRHDLKDGQPPEATSPVRYTPTFLLLREGREIGRLTGYLDAGLFWGLLDQLLDKAKQG